MDVSFMDISDIQKQQILNQLEKHVYEFKASIRNAIESLEILKAEKKLVRLKRSVFFFDLLEMGISDELQEEHSFKRLLSIDSIGLKSTAFCSNHHATSTTNCSNQSNALDETLANHFGQIQMRAELLRVLSSQIWSLKSKGRGHKRKLIDATKRSIFHFKMN